ncbi:transcriptional regulator ArgR [Edwardsiella ictaluri]|uniref:Arginine repressor n=2 Tax=Edwardsiella ictaluri TaxID=67780 RepID=C5BCU9_EDWI9|nr:transcriptional regulator ArgR [Edwardsiella ictaluri]AAT42450.1 arginine repressor [Edwardsiella ictaluri]ACR67555.2 transcriptional repressor, ArgR family [Edwardsiella ictaluri 93-146]ARD40107.1 arginine repressor [Edwardsiella ictaluri]AVZ81969.1 transcriptional regulator ArgR [Edwardsiella ictaluri]EKS7764749.1 transcriptional regulator ArgR [Edwardsiella ictaluri]
MSNKKDLNTVFRKILDEKNFGSQNEIVEYLKSQGFEHINQSKISRMLANFGAVRSRNAKMEMAYCLPTDSVVPNSSSTLKSSIVKISMNEHMVITHTIPGAAPLISRLLDSCGLADGILGTVAGDDTIFIAPVMGVTSQQVYERIKKILDTH